MGFSWGKAMASESLATRERAIALLEQYESLLTESQAQVMDDYYRYDLSLGEIAELRGISRAGVSDSLRKSIAKLEEIDGKLGLVEERATFKKLFLEAESAPTDQDKLEAYRAIGKAYNHGI